MAGAAVLRALRARLPPTLTVASSRCSAPLEFVLPSAPCVLSPPWITSSVRTLQLCSALCAGHNKWSKVKHIKGPKDEARGKMFNKFGMMIRIAVKEGGSNPDLNMNLAHILEQCRNKNMPKASIEAAIKSAEKAKPATQHMFEARGPGGCLLLIEVLTDNNNRSHHEIKRLLNKNGGTLSDGARHGFTRRGVVAAAGENISTERALELAIEAGAADVQETEDEEEQPLLKFVCDTVDLHNVRTSLEKLGIQITSAGVEFIPSTHSSLDQDQLSAASSLIEVLNDCPDVVRVWDNIQADS
ncbi:LOW QUALITY PROTEIN: translational activator of cytochrome c oxidase 1 [Lates calcarifer]|uniref:Translational activator of cytochrome c oxidase 1 n=1 Tax=Lates calcarifer TaxID=8187 RepID=A0AAJ7PCC0_LATCA|nr:LOW QUALITY PROTEIN: translational activator of cytochrome c oxidase 1 [Lates calcarifer]